MRTNHINNGRHAKKDNNNNIYVADEATIEDMLTYTHINTFQDYWRLKDTKENTKYCVHNSLYE